MSEKFNGKTPPEHGQLIGWDGQKLTVPEHPIVAFIEGDGIGPDIWRATARVLEGAVEIIVAVGTLALERDEQIAGTYFPDSPRHGQPSFRQVLEALDKHRHRDHKYKVVEEL